jgi:hypothetical protein
MKKINLALSLLLSLFNTHLFSQHEEKFIDKKNEFSFEENKGQMKDQHWKARPDVLYYGVSEGMNFYIKNSGMSYQLSRVESWKEEDKDMMRASLGSDDNKRQVPDQIGTYRVDAEWLNANKDFTINRGNALEGYNNYYNVPEGVEPALFVKKYETLTLLNVWNGVDIHYYGNGGFLETDYIVAPGADYNQIQIDIKGAELSTDDQGNLILKTPFGEIREGQLKVYQNDVLIEATWKIKGNRVSFDIPNYNPNIAMVIDPLTRVWGTYYGDLNSDYGKSITTDGAGNIYLSGETMSTSGILAAGGHQNTFGGGQRDAFLVKFNEFGVRQWGTFYGGASNDGSGLSTATDGIGNIYLSGYTESTTGIASGGHQNSIGGSKDSYLVKFNGSGLRLWGTYYGGLGQDESFSTVTDGAGNVYISGSTTSTAGIALGGHQNTYGGTTDAFLVKFNGSGVRQWGTYYGGAGLDISYSTSTDGSGNVYITGTTLSTSGIALDGHQNTLGGGNQDGYLVKFNGSGVRQWGTYYGGGGVDDGRSATCDVVGNVYLTGYTQSTNGIALGGHQNSYGGGEDAFLVKFNGLGVRQWGTYYGGIDIEQSYSITTDIAGNVYLTGLTQSLTEIASGGYQNTLGGIFDAFLVKYNDSGIQHWSTYYGGANDDRGFSTTTNISGDVYIAGYTNSGGMALGGYQNTLGGIFDAFLVKFNQSKINGYVWWDMNSNCVKDGLETAVIDGINPQD